MKGLGTAETHDCYVVISKDTGSWVGSEGTLPEGIEGLKDALSEPDKYDVQFRLATECEGFSYKEAYDLAVAHPDDWFELMEFLWFGVDVTASSFIQERILCSIAENEGLDEWTEGEIPFSYEGWNDEIDTFVWDHVLDENEAKAVCEKYGLTIDHVTGKNKDGSNE